MYPVYPVYPVSSCTRQSIMVPIRIVYYITHYALSCQCLRPPYTRCTGYTGDTGYNVDISHKNIPSCTQCLQYDQSALVTGKGIMLFLFADSPGFT